MEPVKKSDPQYYDSWKKTHNTCSLNYTGSSPNMEKIGTQKIVGSSVEKLGLYFTSFYGDGDSKAFSSVENIYGPEKLLVKCECIGLYRYYRIRYLIIVTNLDKLKINE